MEYTTPPSYGSTVVSVGGLATDGQILLANALPPVSHDETAPDSDNAWPEPKAATFKWVGQSKDGKEVDAVLSGKFGERIDRVDVMGEMPKFVKNIVSGASGTKPYIYQVGSLLPWASGLFCWIAFADNGDYSTLPSSRSRSRSATRSRRRRAVCSPRRLSSRRVTAEVEALRCCERENTAQRHGWFWFGDST